MNKKGNYKTNSRQSKSVMCSLSTKTKKVMVNVKPDFGEDRSITVRCLIDSVRQFLYWAEPSGPVQREKKPTATREMRATGIVNDHTLQSWVYIPIQVRWRGQSFDNW